MSDHCRKGLDCSCQHGGDRAHYYCDGYDEGGQGFLDWIAGPFFGLYKILTVLAIAFYGIWGIVIACQFVVAHPWILGVVAVVGAAAAAVVAGILRRKGK